MTAMITEIFYPLLLSYGMAFLASVVLQGRGDAASVTSLTAVFTILAAGLCYRQECRKRKEERMKQWQEKPMPALELVCAGSGRRFGKCCVFFFAFLFAADFGIVQPFRRNCFLEKACGFRKQALELQCLWRKN